MKFVLLGCLIVAFGCKYADPDSKNKLEKFAEKEAGNFLKDTSSYFQVYVDRNDSISLNGNPINASELDIRFQDLANKHGMVLYSSDSATSRPPRTGRVIQLIIKYNLPIKIYTDKTFTKSFD